MIETVIQSWPPTPFPTNGDATLLSCAVSIGPIGPIGPIHPSQMNRTIPDQTGVIRTIPEIKIMNTETTTHRCKSHIARLPKALRDKVNSMLDDGATYGAIVPT
jgi:hypothetical protein